MDWTSVTWSEFTAALQSYRAKFYDGDIQEEQPYITLMSMLGDVAIKDRNRQDIGGAIVHFLNAWHCGLSSARTPLALRDWIAEYAVQIEDISSLSILHDDPRSHQKVVEELYYSLFRFRHADPPIRTMGDAAASKILHIM